MKERVSLLKSKIDEDLGSIGRIYAKIHTLTADMDDVPKEGDTIQLAYHLHNLYNAFENIFVNVASTFENNVEDRSKWHSELLRRMTLDIESIRPRLISRTTANYLDELRRFRHLFRHSYDFDLEWERQHLVLKKAELLEGIYKSEIDEFKRFLDELIK